jgi:hypothetical protein
MFLVGQLMEDIIRLPCTAHTLQLVVGKGLMLAEALVARAKRLMLFFTSPKQMDKLIKIQKKEWHLQTEVKIEFFIMILYYPVNCLIKQLHFFL